MSENKKDRIVNHPIENNLHKDTSKSKKRQGKKNNFKWMLPGKRKVTNKIGQNLSYISNNRILDGNNSTDWNYCASKKLKWFFSNLKM